MWKKLNSPLMITLIIVIAFPLMVGFAVRAGVKSIADNSDQIVRSIAKAPQTIMSNMSSSMDQHKYDKALKAEKELAIFDKVTIEEAQLVVSSNNDKVIGVLKNKSDSVLTQIKLTVSFYDENQQLIDVQTKWLAELKYVIPNEPSPFAIQRYRHNPDEIPAASFKIKVTNFNITLLPADFEENPVLE